MGWGCDPKSNISRYQIWRGWHLRKCTVWETLLWNTSIQGKQTLVPGEKTLLLPKGHLNTGDTCPGPDGVPVSPEWRIHCNVETFFHLIRYK